MSRREAGMLVAGAELAPVRTWIAGMVAHPATVRLDRAVLKALAKREPRAMARPRGDVRAASSDGARLGAVWLIPTEDYVGETKVEKVTASALARELVDGGSVEDASDIDWLYRVGRSLYQRVKPGDRVVEARSPGRYHPRGQLVGFRTCLLPVDLGARIGKRRYRLALTDRSVVSRRLTEKAIARLKRALGLKGTDRLGGPRKVSSSTAAILEELLEP
jgi:hypothetical protein